MPTEHTYKQFDAELEAVRASVLKMGGLVEEQITNALESLISGNMELADQGDANDTHSHMTSSSNTTGDNGSAT